MKILQISDFHLRGDGGLSFLVVDTKACFETTLRHLKHVFSLPNQRPDVIVITGDLADSGDAAAYEILYEALNHFNVPVYAVPGNHDRRDRMRSILKGWSIENPETAPYFCYAVDLKEARLVFCDSMSPGSHSGHFPMKVAPWLERELLTHPNIPTLVFMHHPPIVTGMGAMDEAYEHVDMLLGILSKAPWARLCCGHMHRPIMTMVSGISCITAPATSMQIELDFSKEGGDEFRMEAPGYLLHDLENGVFNTHICQIYGQPTYAGPYPFAGKVNPKEED